MEMEKIYIPFSDLKTYPNWAPYFVITAIQWLWWGKPVVTKDGKLNAT